jgi:hypothetical protein
MEHRQLDLIAHIVLKRCKADPEYKQELLDSLVELEEAIEIIRQKVIG